MAWVLWHLEWCLGNCVAACQHENGIQPSDYSWSGGFFELERRLDEWGQLLRCTRPHSPIDGIPGLTLINRTFEQFAGWVNLEIIKNLTSISDLNCRRANVWTETES